MFKFYFYTLLLIISISKLNAQFTQSYTPLKSSGKLPADFVERSSEKYRNAKSENESKSTKEENDIEDRFLLATNFEIDNILLSGKVLFNDPISLYISKVADKVLENDRETRSKLRFYLLQSTAVNAFSTSQGIIIITTGMLAQIENEAQLAFVLCHEISHFKEKHSMKKFEENENIQEGKGEYKRLSASEKRIAGFGFSKEQEEEADKKGLEMFLKTSYSTSTILGVFDVLKYSHLPFDEVDFPISFFENANLKFPSTYKIEKTKEINTKDEEDDDEDDHPALPKRRDYILKKIETLSIDGKSDYLVSKEEFEQIREIGRFELTNLFVIRKRYESAIYNSFLLLQKYPENVWLKEKISQSLVALTAYSNENEYGEVHIDPEDIEGKSQAVYHLFEKIDSVEGDVNIVSLAWVANEHFKYPQSKVIKRCYNELLKRLYDDHGKTFDDFRKVSITKEVLQDTTSVVDTTKEVESTVALSKYEKIKKQEVEIKTTQSQWYSNFAFAENANLKTMESDLLDAIEEVRKEKELKDKKPITSYRGGRRGSFTYYCLGVNKALVVDPFYVRLNANKSKDKLRYLESESGQIEFQNNLKDISKNAKLDIEIISSRDLDYNDIEKINDLYALENYIIERTSQENDVDFPSSEREKMLELAKKYNTDYFIWMGASYVTRPQRFKAGTIVMSTIFPFILPFTLDGLIHGGHYLSLYALMYDVKNDKVILAKSQQVVSRESKAVWQSQIYDLLSQISAKPKMN